MTPHTPISRAVSKRRFTALLAAAPLLLGASGSALAQASEPRELRLGVLLPVSGPLAFVGVAKKKAVDLLVEQINARGGMDKHKIKMFFYDTESNTTLVAQQFRRLAETDKVDIVIGPTVTGETLSARPVANELKVPVVPFAGTEAVINPVTPYLFAFVPSDRQVARKMLESVKAKGLKSVAFLHSADGFGQTGLRVMKELTAQMGISLSTVEEFGPRDSDMTPQIMRIRAGGADAMFVWGVNPGPTIIMKNAQALGFKKPIYNSYGVASQQFIQQAGSAVEGTYVAATAIMGALQFEPNHPVRKATEKFIVDFEQRYKEPVSTFTGYVFDAMNLVERAVIKAGSVEREDLAKALRNGGISFTGANGKLLFRAGNASAQTDESDPIVILKIQNGKFVLEK